MLHMTVIRNHKIHECVCKGLFQIVIQSKLSQIVKDTQYTQRKHLAQREVRWLGHQIRKKPRVLFAAQFIQNPQNSKKRFDSA